MAQKYLINQATFTDYEDISVNIEATRLNVFIKKAQDMDLKPFLNAVFYYDMIKNVVIKEDGTIDTDATPQIYVDLLLGKEYKNKAGQFLYCDGLIPALVYWSFARFVQDDWVRYTNTGPVQKDHDQATPLSASAVNGIVQQHRSTANAKANDVIAFLDTNRNIYPLWRYNSRNAQSRQPGPRIRAVDATDVRGRYYRDGNGYLNGLLP